MRGASHSRQTEVQGKKNVQFRINNNRGRHSRRYFAETCVRSATVAVDARPLVKSKREIAHGSRSSRLNIAASVCSERPLTNHSCHWQSSGTFRPLPTFARERQPISNHPAKRRSGLFAADVGLGSRCLPIVDQTQFGRDRGEARIAQCAAHAPIPEQ